MDAIVLSGKKIKAAEKTFGTMLYIFITMAVFAIFAIAFVLFPRPEYSELEKRELAQFPEFSLDKLASSQYSAELSHWFNDSEPFRDVFMGMSLVARDAMRQSFGGSEAISFHAPEAANATVEPIKNEAQTVDEVEEEELTPQVPIIDEGVTTVSHNGIVVVGSGENVRALMAYGGRKGGESHVKMAKKYAELLPSLKIYSMVVPLASEFYLPEKAKNMSQPQISTIENIRDNLAGTGIVSVDAYHALQAHLNENIYLRTDHHWAPLGAYYAAKQLAMSAGVPYKDLSAYDVKTVHRFVGTMYGYSHDIAIKKAPEDFVYYVPNQVEYSTIYNQYSVDKDFRVTGESKDMKGPFFYEYKDGSGAAYSTFMGGDIKLTHVHTGTTNGRRLLIIKDSYGNAVPGFLFYSFEDIHVVDFRYFTRNMVKYCEDNNITDLAFIFNIFNAYSSSSASRCEKFLTQKDRYIAPAPKKKAQENEILESTGEATEKSENQTMTEEPAKLEEPEKAEAPSAEPVKIDEPINEPATEPLNEVQYIETIC